MIDSPPPARDDRGRRRLGAWLAVAATAFLVGCVSEPDHRLIYWMLNGRFEHVERYLQRHQSSNPKDRDYVLGQMRLGLAALATQDVDQADRTWETVFDVLRTQGVNADKTVASVVINEDVKLWKGEPFEQAMAFFYVAVHYAGLGSWDNARAGALNSLFYLRDFGLAPDGHRLTSEDLIRSAQEQGDAYLDHGYVATPSTFALGYLMAGLANAQLDRVQEAQDQMAAAVRLQPDLAELADELLGRQYNLVLVVDYGLGPMKIGVGPDGAIARFIPITPSDRRPLRVTVDGRVECFPAAADLNVMAVDHRWNNLEDVRLAKSRIGSLLVAAGAVTTAIGAEANSKEAVIGGLSGVAAGAIAKAGAHADTRYVEIMPQRVYLAPLKVRHGQTIEISLAGAGGRQLVIDDPPSRSGQAALRYVRLTEYPASADSATCSSGFVVVDSVQNIAPQAMNSK